MAPLATQGQLGSERPRYYRITEEGWSPLFAEVARLSGYVAAALARNIS